jgi:hypothetical protein
MTCLMHYRQLITERTLFRSISEIVACAEKIGETPYLILSGILPIVFPSGKPSPLPKIASMV